MDHCCGSSVHSHEMEKLPNLRFGRHISLRNDLHDTLDHEPNVTFQCFMGPPQSYEIRFLNDEDRLVSEQLIRNNRRSFYVHAPYLVNFANDRSDMTWKGKSVIRNISKNIGNAPAGIVLHVGSNSNRTQGLNNIIERVNDLINERVLLTDYTGHCKFKLLMEMSAGDGNKLGRDWEEMRKLYEGFDRCQVGMCYDTQHGFASGLNPLQNHEDVCRMFEDSYNCSGFYPTMIHLNDSETEFRSKHDRHASLGCGYMWDRNKEGLYYLRKFCQELEIDMISETPDSFNDMQILESIGGKFY